jgi:CTP:molybdopterin cytidylyltransferase MocA
MHDITILIPAAGSSSRMRGRDKLLEDVGGQPLLARQTRMALATGAPVLVTLRPRDQRSEVLPRGAKALNMPEASEGLAASLRSGAAWAEALGANALMVVLADLPDLTAQDLETVADHFSEEPRRICRATDESGQAGHPVIFPSLYFAQIQRLSGDDGAKAILAQNPPRICRLPALHATTDLDTPEAWTAWRAGQTRK